MISPAARRTLRSISLAGPAGKLEAILNEGSPDAPFAALVAHPHPPSGGSMHNKVVYHAMKTINAPEWGFEWPVLRFNFRGTGLSEGSYDGHAEAKDVSAALDWLKNEYRRPIVAVGFSFGAAMTLAACCTRCSTAEIRAIAALGLPIQSDHRSYDYPQLRDCTLPMLFLSGDHDLFAPRETLTAVTEAASQPRRTIFVKDANHFFTGRLEAMQQELAAWLQGLKYGTEIRN
jgi:alpha/beta superfamily hydrolase